MMFLRELFSEPSGQASSNRVCVLAIVIILLVCLTKITLETGRLPEVPAQFASMIEWLISAFLFGNVVKNGIAAITQNK